MLKIIPHFLPSAELSSLVISLSTQIWEDGAKTAPNSTKRKYNEQLTTASQAAMPLLGSVAKRVMAHPEVKAWAEPRRIARLMFGRYGPGMYYASHNDAALISAGNIQARADISFTLFLAEPKDYEGGELVLETSLGEKVLKESAGTLVMYNTGIRHRVAEVTAGTRLVAVGWLESLIRDPGQREVLQDINAALAALPPEDAFGETAFILRRTRISLQRLWAET